MTKKIKFGDITTGNARLSNSIPIDPAVIGGMPRKGVELVGSVFKKPYQEYQGNEAVPGSEDPSRTVKLTFHAYDLRLLSRLREDLKNGDIDRDEYDDEVAGLAEFPITISNEEDCNEFLNRYKKLVDGLDKGHVYDYTGTLSVVPVYRQKGWPGLACTFPNVDSLTFNEFKLSSLGGSNEAKS